MKKILVISFFFPPSSKAGAHRAISLAEYLPTFGWEPVFITVPIKKTYYGNPPRIDNNLLSLVKDSKTYRIPYVAPFHKNNNSLFMRIGRRIWEKFWVPDSKILWNVAIKRKLDEIISENEPRAVYITSTPFSTFLLAPFIKNKYHLPVILDYRDPWTGNVFINKTFLRKKTSMKQEQKSVAKADMITAASFFIKDHVKKIVSGSIGDTEFFPMPYGFDERKFSLEEEQISRHNNDKIKITFAGSVHGDISAELILKGIKGALEKNPDLKTKLEIHSYGTLFGKGKNIKPLLSKYGLSNVIIHKPYVPYKEFIQQLLISDFLLLPHGDSYIARLLFPTKLFDYLGAKKPIIYIGGSGQVWETIKELNAGICLPPDEKSLSDFFCNIQSFINESWYNNTEKYLSFSRTNIIGRFAKELDDLVSN